MHSLGMCYFEEGGNRHDERTEIPHHPAGIINTNVDNNKTRLVTNRA